MSPYFGNYFKASHIRLAFFIRKKWNFWFRLVLGLFRLAELVLWLSAIAQTGGRVLLTWTGSVSSDVANYKVYYRSSSVSQREIHTKAEINNLEENIFLLYRSSIANRCQRLHLILFDISGRSANTKSSRYKFDGCVVFHSRWRCRTREKW